ncbi:diphosphoinositol polyphosphate phosphohydrolase 1-like [Haliotis cracherodii]|uniref:diphosphoinositol polyphosphate phosphohydrolase 1-like n=1 Tax=Haliotis rufescens TaxID=6454 RepID=UPI001EAF8EA2|nr:diphosphoinositol polyphosphate phosphohydrolase 1-like [Haliotis rufescens]
MVKEKPDSIRTYDQDGYRRRAACLCFKDSSEQEILLVTSSRYRDRWVVPGGGIEPEEETKIAASREAREEAGVLGQLGRHLGNFENEDKKHRTSVFTFVVTDLLDEWEDSKSMGRKREWFPLCEARERLLHKPVQVTYLELLKDRPLVT